MLQRIGMTWGPSALPVAGTVVTSISCVNIALDAVGGKVKGWWKRFRMQGQDAEEDNHDHVD